MGKPTLKRSRHLSQNGFAVLAKERASRASRRTTACPTHPSRLAEDGEHLQPERNCVQARMTTSIYAFNNQISPEATP
jgi:hypothetical protein